MSAYMRGKLLCRPEPEQSHQLMMGNRKFKLPNQQNGQVYLTSHRICYVDKEAPRKHSVALDLKEIERYEFYVCFCRICLALSLLDTNNA